MSVNVGGRIGFKVDTTAASFRIDIYRTGFYGGSGARAITSVSATTARSQPTCLSNPATGLVDCGNWSESASWTVPGDAVSGVCIARLVRTSGTAGASHVIFVVRDDASRSDLVFQTSDTTWQTYNQCGGNSLYTGGSVGRAYKVSYNRPLTTRGTTPEDSVFNAEYPLIRWLEANGYDVTYSSGVDSDRRGALIRNHKTFLSVGHDEYWSGNQRTQVEAARDAFVPGSTPPPGPDTTPPTVTGRTPAAGATGVATTTTVSATFSEAVTGGALTVAASAGGAVAGTAALDGTGRILTFTPSAALTAATAYTASLSGAADASGNVMQAVSWSFTTASAPPPPGACPCTLWPATTVPVVSTSNDTAAVELGVRFSSDVSGFVTGVRFFKGARNTGTHLGRLWSATGTQLATATFTGETANGWQQVNFATPVAVTAGTTYIASYYTPVGRYAADENYFASTGITRAPLRSPASAVNAANNVYRYCAGGGFPSSTDRSTNYWVDVVFATG